MVVAPVKCLNQNKFCSLLFIIYTNDKVGLQVLMYSHHIRIPNTIRSVDNS